MKNPECAARVLRATGELARAIGIHAPIKVLLVEDAPTYALVFCTILSRVKGTLYEVETVADALSAAAIIREGMHDIYVIDLQLGGVSGLDMVAALQRDGCHFPFIILTGMPDDASRAAMSLDCMVWLRKPDNTSPSDLDLQIRFAIKNWLTRACYSHERAA